MRAFVLNKAGETPVVADFQEPEAKSNREAVVKILAAGLNPYDRYVAQSPEPLPRVVGLEAIAELSDGKKVYVGQAIAPYGTLAEKALTKADSNIPLPDGLDNGSGLVIGTSGLAAWLPLSWKAKVQKNESVLILGATGVQGQVAVQAAKLLGAGYVVAAGRNREVLEKLKDHGADDIAVLEGDLSAAIKKAAPEGGYQVVIDSVFGEPFTGLMKSSTLGSNSRVVVLGGSAGQEITLGFRELQATQGATIAGYSTHFVPVDIKRQAYLAMAEHIKSGEIKVEVKSYPLEKAAEAWQMQASGPHQKIIIEP